MQTLALFPLPTFALQNGSDSQLGITVIPLCLAKCLNANGRFPLTTAIMQTRKACPFPAQSTLDLSGLCTVLRPKESLFWADPPPGRHPRPQVWAERNSTHTLQNLVDGLKISGFADPKLRRNGIDPKRGAWYRESEARPMTPMKTENFTVSIVLKTSPGFGYSECDYSIDRPVPEDARQAISDVLAKLSARVGGYEPATNAEQSIGTDRLRLAKDLALKLDGRQYGDEISIDDENQAKRDGLVVVFGYSDDNAEFRGAINDEAGCGSKIYLTKAGLLTSHDEDSCECEFCGYEAAKKSAKVITPIWDEDGISWQYRTDIPHSTFRIMEGSVYCIGIVFSVDSL